MALSESTPMQTERLIEQLSAELTPVRPLHSPAQRAGFWLLLVGTLAAGAILRFADLPAILPRLALPRVTAECIGAGLTAVTATWAAFEMSVPDHSPRWLWAPVAPLALWLGASGLGCLANGMSLHGPDGFVGESGDCFRFICAVSAPLAVGLFWMLRRARPMDALPVAAMGTLGVAASAALILQFFHPFDVTVIDLTLHLSAVGLVMALGTIWRRGLLDASISR
jgi:hypothetical protein